MTSGQRDLLGPADVDDELLRAMVAETLGADPGSVELLSSSVEVVDYDLPAITTAGRYWVDVRARVAGGAPLDVRLFVKHIQNWRRSPMFAFVPPEVREIAAAGVPWRTEALAYGSDLGDRLPDGLRMPRALAVVDLDECSAAVWLEEVPVHDADWDSGRFARAARLLGRLSASDRVAPLTDVGRFGWQVQMYVDGRLRHQVLPILRSPGIWDHPLLGAFDADLRARLLAAADRVEEYGAELGAMPILAAHGDACPNNLMAGPDGDFVLIDYGFWGPNPVGFDLGQLLVGDVQVGRRPASSLAETDAAIVPAYVEGLRDEGCELPEAVVRRAHALQLLLFTGLSALPFEVLDQPPTPALHHLASERAALAAYVLDLVDGSCA